jgi:hypothetical protein
MPAQIRERPLANVGVTSPVEPHRGAGHISAPDSELHSPSPERSVTHRHTSDTIASLLRIGKVRRRQFMELARLAVSLDSKLAPIIADWDYMKPPLQNAADLDVLCEAHGVDPVHLIGVVGEAEMKFLDNACIILAALQMPAILEHSIKAAKGMVSDNGWHDRKMLFEHAGFLPVPPARKVRMLNQAAIAAESHNGGGKPLESFETTMERIDKMMRDEE